MNDLAEVRQGIHELPLETCSYCRPRRQQQVATVVFISPQRVGHLDE